MGYLGTWQINDLLTFTVNTHTPSTGAATDADAVPDYRVYEDETATPLLTGSMAKLDDANTVGFYSEQLTLSAANGFEVGKCYTIYVTATVGGVVGTLSHTFQVESAASSLTANDIADAVLSRGVSNVENSADTTSLAAVILAILESSSSGTTWTIRKTGGTTFATKTLTLNPSALPITGVT